MHLLTVLRSIGDILFEKVCENIAKNDYLGHLDHGSFWQLFFSDVDSSVSYSEVCHSNLSNTQSKTYIISTYQSILVWGHAESLYLVSLKPPIIMKLEPMTFQVGYFVNFDGHLLLSCQVRHLLLLVVMNVCIRK